MTSSHLHQWLISSFPPPHSIHLYFPLGTMVDNISVKAQSLFFHSMYVLLSFFRMIFLLKSFPLHLTIPDILRFQTPYNSRHPTIPDTLPFQTSHHSRLVINNQRCSNATTYQRYSSSFREHKEEGNLIKPVLNCHREHPPASNVVFLVSRLNGLCCEPTDIFTTNA